MWRISRIVTTLFSLLLVALSLFILILTIYAIIHYKHNYTFVPWNIMIMTTLTGITGGIALVTGLVSGVGAVIQKKAVILVSLVLLILSVTTVVFIGIYSFSGVAYTDVILERGWDKMVENNDDGINDFEEVWGCSGFSENTVNTTTISSESGSSLPYCLDVLRKPFKVYSGVMLSIASCVFLLLVCIEMAISFHVSTEDKIKPEFMPINEELK
ncbi:PH domain containing protein [Entamoeba marina]